MFWFPGNQAKLPPLREGVAVSVTLSPEHTEAEFIDTEGLSITITVVVTGAAEQVASLPFKVYTVVAAGLTVTIFPVRFPGLQL